MDNPGRGGLSQVLRLKLLICLVLGGVQLRVDLESHLVSEVCTGQSWFLLLERGLLLEMLVGVDYHSLVQRETAEVLDEGVL